MQIETKRLVLRQYEKEDAIRMVEIISNSDKIKSMLGYSRKQYFLIDARKYISTRGRDGYYFAITLYGLLIGACGIHKKQNETTISMWIADEYQNKGYGTEALHVLCLFGYYYCNISEYHMYYYSNNCSSLAIQKKIGAIEDVDYNKNISLDSNGIGKYRTVIKCENLALEGCKFTGAFESKV